MVYTKGIGGDSNGMTFYFGFQGIWTSEMVVDLKNDCSEKLAVCRPAEKIGNITMYPFWKVPMRMPKLYTIISHISQFIRATGC